MKTMLRYLAPVIVVLAGGYTARGVPVPNLLADPGFESGTTVAGGMGGWGELNGAAFSQTYAHAGLWSLKDPSAISMFQGSKLCRRLRVRYLT